MRYQISGRQIAVGEALQTHVQSEISELVEKYAQRPTEALIIFSKEAHEFICEAAIHLSTGLTTQARGHATEVYTAFEACSEKLDKQMRRYKRRLRDNHHERHQPVEFAAGSSYIRSVNDGETQQRIIIAEMETKVPNVTVGEASIQMELSGENILVFCNEGHGGINVVYRRDDGNIGWIDPHNTK